MKPDFYSPEDSPTSWEKQRMWNAIELAVAEQRLHQVKPLHWKSFWIGCAASILILFAVVGMFAIGSSFLNKSAGQTSLLDKNYERAMNQLISVTPDLMQQAGEVERSVIESKIKRIEDLDAMIEEIRNDMLLNGTSTVKRMQLKRLYAMKMDHVKELLLLDEVAL